MAKIYETREDVAREQVQEQLRQAQRDRSASGNSILNGFILSSFSSTLKENADLAVAAGGPATSGFMRGFYKVGIWVGIISGVSSVISWWKKRQEVEKLDAKLKDLGPQEIVYPPSIAEGLQACNHCERLKQEVAGSERSL